MDSSAQTSAETVIRAGHGLNDQIQSLATTPAWGVSLTAVYVAIYSAVPNGHCQEEPKHLSRHFHTLILMSQKIRKASTIKLNKSS